MCATARIMRSKSARSSRRERQGQAQAHRARPQPEGAGEGAPQDATAQGAQVREALSATGEASGPDGGRRLKFWDGIQRFVRAGVFRTTQHDPASGARSSARVPRAPAAASRPRSRARFIPHTRGRHSLARASNGQFRSRTSPLTRAGSYPHSSSTAMALASRRSVPAFPLVLRRASAPSLRPSARAARWSAPRAAGATAVNARAKTRPASSYRRSGSVRSSWRVERWYSLAGRPAPGPRRTVSRRYLASPLGDVEIKTPPDRFVEQRDDGDLALEIGAWHDKNLHRAQARSNRSNGSVYCAYRSAQARCPTTLTSLSAVA